MYNKIELKILIVVAAVSSLLTIPFVKLLIHVLSTSQYKPLPMVLIFLIVLLSLDVFAWYGIVKKISGSINERRTVKSLNANKKHEQSGRIIVPDRYDKWSIYKVYDDVNVCTNKNDKLDYGRLFLTGVVMLEQEPENPYDSRAVAVTQCGQKLGYIYRGNMQDMINDFMDREEPVNAWLTKIDSENNKLQIKAAFYR